MGPGGRPRRLHLGCGRYTKPGWLNADIVALPGVGLRADFARFPWPSRSLERLGVRHPRLKRSLRRFRWLVDRRLERDPGAIHVRLRKVAAAAPAGA